MITRNQNEYQELSNFLTNATYSDNNYDSTQQPFMLKSLGNPVNTNSDMVNINNKIVQLNITGKLKKLYQIIGNPTIECYINNWTIMSLNNIIKQYHIYKEKKQLRAIDFAFIYAGMGHMVICSYDPKTKKIYYKRDGGSNGYDRQLSFVEACNYIPVTTDLFQFEHLMEQIGRTNINPFELPVVNR